MAKPNKPRHRLHVSVGAAGACPDCGELTSFHQAALLGECSPHPWTIDADLLRALANTLGKTATCKSCRRKPTRLHWVELADAAVLGPFCTTCLRKQRHDLPLYVAAASKATLLDAALIREYAPKPPTVSATDSQLF